jgi:hypothetical protein
MLARAALATVLAALGLLCSLGSPVGPAWGDDKGKAKAPENDVPKELAPRPFTLQGKDLELPKVLAELAKQTGNAIEDRRREKNETKVKLDLKNATFWQAVDAIAKESDARINLYDPSGKVVLVDGPYLVQPVSYSGIFRLAVKRVDTSHFLDMGSHTMVVHLDVAWEPRFQPFFMENKPEALVVQDDKKRMIEVGDGGQGRAPVNNRVATELRIQLPAPQRSAGQLAVFKGKLSALLPLKMLSFTFDNLAKIDKAEGARKIAQDGVTVHLRELKPEGEEDEQIWTVGVLLEYPIDSSKLESFQSRFVRNEIYLEKEKDGILQRFPSNLGSETGDQDDNRAVLRYRFGDEPEKKLIVGKISDWKLVYKTPGKIVELAIPFEFKDIELP